MTHKRRLHRFVYQITSLGKDIYMDWVEATDQEMSDEFISLVQRMTDARYVLLGKNAHGDNFALPPEIAKDTIVWVEHKELEEQP